MDDDSTESKVAFGIVGIAVGFGLWKIYRTRKQVKRLDKMVDAIVEFIDSQYQKAVDEVFEDIVDNYDE